MSLILGLADRFALVAMDSSHRTRIFGLKLTITVLSLFDAGWAPFVLPPPSDKNIGFLLYFPTERTIMGK